MQPETHNLSTIAQELRIMNDRINGMQTSLETMFDEKLKTLHSSLEKSFNRKVDNLRDSLTKTVNENKAALKQEIEVKAMPVTSV